MAKKKDVESIQRLEAAIDLSESFFANVLKSFDQCGHHMGLLQVHVENLRLCISSARDEKNRLASELLSLKGQIQVEQAQHAVKRELEWTREQLDGKLRQHSRRIIT